MLILQRKPGESFQIGDNITISVVSIEKGRVRISIDAPSEISIMRTELLQTKEANKASVLDPGVAANVLELISSVQDQNK